MTDVAVQRAVTELASPTDDDFNKWAECALAGKKKGAEISVRLVDEAEGHELNLKYRGKNKATNVLSFPTDLPPGLNIPLLGDIVICIPVVESEAKEQNKPLQNHWAHLFIHGVLHLLGMDHVEDQDAKLMEAEEVRILALLNIDNPYQNVE